MPPSLSPTRMYRARWFYRLITSDAELCPFRAFRALPHRTPGMKAGGLAGLLSTAGVAAATHFLPRYVLPLSLIDRLMQIEIARVEEIPLTGTCYGTVLMAPRKACPFCANDVVAEPEEKPAVVIVLNRLN